MKKIIPEYKVYPLHNSALAQAVVFLFFTIIVWGLDGDGCTSVFYVILGVFSFGASLFFSVAALFNSVNDRLKQFENKKPSSRRQGFFLALYWGFYTIVYLIAYITSWIGGAIAIEYVPIRVFVIISGFVLILIIGIVLAKPIFSAIYTNIRACFISTA